MEFHSVIRKNDNVDDLEGIMLSWNKSNKRQKPYYFTYMCNLKKQNKWTKKQKQIHRYKEQNDGWLGVEAVGENGEGKGE